MTPFSRLDTLYELAQEKKDASIQYRTVRNLQELKTAINLVSRHYAHRGYLDSPDAQLKQTMFHALPSTVTFIAEHDALGIIGTLTLIVDSPFGLPMDDLYQKPMNTLREEGDCLAEASMLTIDTQRIRKQLFPQLRPDNFAITLNLFKSMFDYLRHETEVTELMACINPKHQLLYSFLHFDQLGDTAAYPTVNGHLAIGMHLNVGRTGSIAHRYPVLRFFYDDSARNAKLRMNRNRVWHDREPASPVAA